MRNGVDVGRRLASWGLKRKMARRGEEDRCCGWIEVLGRGDP